MKLVDVRIATKVFLVIGVMGAVAVCIAALGA